MYLLDPTAGRSEAALCDHAQQHLGRAAVDGGGSRVAIGLFDEAQSFLPAQGRERRNKVDEFGGTADKASVKNTLAAGQ